ncbi:MAG: hypothetical protein ACR2NA_05485 [Solirubrobacterales bacterium]
MSAMQFSAVCGFAFTFVWIVVGFGDAVLCLVGAAVFAVAVGLARGQVDLTEIQERLGPGRPGGPGAEGRRPAAQGPSRSGRSRVR